LLQLDERRDAARRKEMRAEPRSAVSLMAVVRRPGGRDVHVEVRNLSSGGMMARCPAGFVRGETIEVKLKGIGVIGGRIAWTAHERLGVAFDCAIDPARAY